MGVYADRAWLYQRAFVPDTEEVRRRIADAFDRCAPRIVNAVLAAVADGSADPASRRLLDSQAEYARHGVALIVRWIRSGAVASQAELEQMRGTRPKAASVTGQITRMVRANLAFRDAAQRVLRQEVGRCGGSVELLLALCAGVDVGFSQNLLQIGRTFDRRSQAFEAALAEKEAELQHQALHDPLTGLANRVLLFDRLGQACERLRRHPERGGVGVLFIDLDDFKLVNDRHGHAAGDAVLRETARRLTATVRPEDTVARLGGDEFVVMCESVPDASWAETAGRRIADEFTTPMAFDDAVVRLTASIGTAVGFPPDCGVERLVHDADHAMYRVKRRVKDPGADRFRAVPAVATTAPR